MSMESESESSGEERVKRLKCKSESDSESELDKEMAVYRERSRNLTRFDAIKPPEDFRCGIAPIDLIPLCNLALDKYNADNQGANFVFDDIVKSTAQGGHCIDYYITFQAKDATHPSNSPAITFQALVFYGIDGLPVVSSCAMKPT